MSTIQVYKQQSVPEKILIAGLPSKKETNLATNGIKCMICSDSKVPCIFDESRKPLVLKCRVWPQVVANTSSC
ncbi:hypothetical protein [Candidatus Nitrosotenuis aquarius]|uniref:hypothetical protein n=1 Tax=Candidatus Nitrosotenuis aquarius TaxID=1846278 RepID=UPI000C1F0E9C|nr:hypothetical protein [Candidatus Nitrosotenuis aquarius]